VQNSLFTGIVARECATDSSAPNGGPGGDRAEERGVEGLERGKLAFHGFFGAEETVELPEARLEAVAVDAELETSGVEDVRNGVVFEAVLRFRICAHANHNSWGAAVVWNAADAKLSAKRWSSAIVIVCIESSFARRSDGLPIFGSTNSSCAIPEVYSCVLRAKPYAEDCSVPTSKKQLVKSGHMLRSSFT
jgi:hypothetical protein